MVYIDLYKESEFLKFRNEINQYLKNECYSKSISILNDVLKEYVRHPGVYYLLSLTHFKSKEYTKALIYVKQAIQLDENAIEHISLAAEICFELSDYEQSYTYSQRAYNLNSNNVETLINFGKLYLTKDDYENAIKYSELALKQDSNSFEAYRLLSKCHMAMGNDFSKTIGFLKKAKKLGYDDEIDYDIIKTLYVFEEYDECIKYCKKILIKNPNSSAAEKATEILSKIRKRRLDSKGKNEEESNFSSSERQTSSLEEALQKLNSLTGLKDVKLEVDRIVRLIKFEKNRSEILNIESKSSQSYHFAFYGNPGTGKTTVARLLGDIFFYLGVLEKGHLVEVDRSNIVGQYIGQTAQLTKGSIEKAMGGVLFIDEAYSLARGGNDSNDFGPEAIDTLIKAMEDHRGNFIVVLAGYIAEMKNLLKLNPGLKSRINIEIEFSNYSDDELLTIAKKIAGENYYTLSEEAEKSFMHKIDIQKVDDNFANARTVRNIIESAIREKAYRTGDMRLSKEDMSLLEPIDFGDNLKYELVDIDSIMEQLNNLTGLKEVKEIINKVINFIKLSKKREEMGVKSTPLSLNMIFTGSPGTGKTTVARLVSQILKSIGILKKGHLVEVTREDLVGKYIGQTGPKTLEKIKEAYGGVLFMDEAYSLCQNSESDFGKEALATIIKEMEDNRDKLVIIMAGYTNEMNQLVNLNPGLKSRIGYFIEFSDYKPQELFEIFINFCKSENYTISNEAEDKIKYVFDNIYNNRDRNFGNGRAVRQIFENIKIQQAERVISTDCNNIFEILENDII